MSDYDPPSGNYYYASGKPVRLTPDKEWVAVDVRRSEASGAGQNFEALVREVSRPLRGDLVLLRRDALSSRQLDTLAKRAAIQPVFRAEGAMLVALPEVRLEEPSLERREAIHRWLRQHASDAEIVEDRGDRIVVRPTSGCGQDALALANQLTEEIGPEMAQPRFLRVVDRFDR
jgi:hypothetical protein